MVENKKELTVEEYFQGKRLPGFSYGILGSPRLYERPDEADDIASKEVVDQVRRFGQRNPLRYVPSGESLKTGTEE